MQNVEPLKKMLKMLKMLKMQQQNKFDFNGF